MKRRSIFRFIGYMFITAGVLLILGCLFINIKQQIMRKVALEEFKTKIEEAYNKNLQDYRSDIPNLFPFNQICVLSN